MCTNSNNSRLNRLCKIDQYAQYLQVSRSTIFNWIKNKKLIEGHHYLRIGRNIRFYLDKKLIGELHEPSNKEDKGKKNISTQKKKKIDLTY